ncbi:MAG: glycosyltransferase, partial [Saprospiraceae bacterium]|nr:glycosyltransferase [Saprospiraceae bacterium]
MLLTYAWAFRRQRAAGSRQQAAGSRQQAAGSRQQAAGSGQRAAGSRQQVSVVIAARNERGNIGACLQSVFALDPLEVIVVDDHSTDGTAEFVEAEFPLVRLIRLSEHLTPGEVVFSFKKRALETGIAHAKGAWIFCTDADCVLKQSTVDGRQSTVFPEQPLWWDNDQSKSDCRLLTGDCRLVCLCGPVLIHAPRGFLQHFEALDVLNLAGVSGAGMALGWHHLGNGANLLFEKKAFEAVGGYASHAGRTSGDDVFLIQEFAKRYPG